MATPYGNLSWGYRRGIINEQNALYRQRRKLEEQQALRNQRIADAQARISTNQWNPDPDEQVTKITTKADGTTKVVTEDKYDSIPETQIAQENLRQRGYGMTYPDDQGLLGSDGLDMGSGFDGLGGLKWADVNPAMGHYIDAKPDINPPDPSLFPGITPGDRFDDTPPWYEMGRAWTETGSAMDPQPYAELPGGQTVGEATAAAFPEEEVPFYQQRPPVFIDPVSPEGTPVPGVDMGGIERFDPRIIPDEAYRQAYGDQERVMGLRGMLEDQESFYPPIVEPVSAPDLQVMEPQPQMPMINRALSEVDRGTANILPPMGDMPPTLPSWFTGMGEAEAPFVAPQAITPDQGPIGPPGQYSAPPWDRMGMLGDEEILAGAQMPYGDPGVTPLERALLESQEGPPVEVNVPDIFADVEPVNEVEVDILESQLPQGAPVGGWEGRRAETWVNPDTGVPPSWGLLEDDQSAFMDPVSQQFEMDTDMILDPNLAKVTDSIKDLYEMQKMNAMMALMEEVKKKKKPRTLKGVGRQGRGREGMYLLNPTPLNTGNA